MIGAARVVSLLALSAAAGCQTLQDPSSTPPTGVTTVNDTLVDARPAVVRSAAPPPISGGTLLTLSGGRFAVVSDPDRDRVLVVDYLSKVVVRQFQLEAGTEPGRATEDKAGHAFVVLRGTGEVATIDMNNFQLTELRRVCSLPRGIAFDANAQRLLVACAEGKLVNLALSGDERVETTAPADVRDVVFAGDKVVLSRFRSAELVALDAEHHPVSSRPLPEVMDVMREADSTGNAREARFEAALAWRTIGRSDGSVVVVHQRAVTEEIDVSEPHSDTTNPGSGPSGSGVFPGSGDQSPYGGSSFTGCGGIVHTGVTVVSANGDVTTSPQLGGVVLPVDVAVSNDGTIAVASAGVSDTRTISGGVTVLRAQSLTRESGSSNCISSQGFAFSAQQPVTAVAFNPTGEQLLVQTRQPSQLLVASINGSFAQSAIDLGGEDVTDTGHDIFHRDSGGGLACASCHAEGKDDGRTWNFSDSGLRRTQPLDIGLEGTQPFHWDGNLPTLGSLMNEVFVGRMAGPMESPERVDALGHWLFQQHTRPPLRAADDPAALRGEALFQSSSVGCTQCHSGSKLTSAGNFDVGSGGKFQVPSLRGVAHRLPVMHNGCAVTLRDRFNPACGGEQHGNTASLDEDQLQDLVAYLESL